MYNRIYTSNLKYYYLAEKEWLYSFRTNSIKAKEIKPTLPLNNNRKFI